MQKIAHRATTAFCVLVLAASLGVMASIMGGGGFTKRSSSRASSNDDPRTVLVESVYLEVAPEHATAPEVAAVLDLLPSAERPLTTFDGATFLKIREAAALASSAGSARVCRTPALAVQHEDHGTIEWIDTPTDESIEPTTLHFEVSPRVLKEGVLRIAMSLSAATRIEPAAGSAFHASRSIETAMTLKDARAVAMIDHVPGGGAPAVLVVRATLITDD